ncbi:ATP-binding cassette domain-containing protein [Thalassotalea euphylliae]|uniref:ATP-binding cassette domain-containing protein n=1 Tax=Thalassotalea euphylliae TaxID=1655234 RepID=A0A3E0U019_9GAMM|nr:ATP-binding cassette domain-containing protein [Thalassotalea euphylliae]REL30064.1 ATP-binding cassette domain-containing protein [Thalassotalea euphylliae]
MVSEKRLLAEINQLVISFRELNITRGQQRILSDATGHIFSGELVALIGENGAGKSTLLHALAGQIPATGCIELHGKALSAWPIHELAKYRAVLNQHNALPFAFSVPELVTMGRYQMVESNAERNDKVAQYIAEVELSHKVSRKVNQLSGGELQRLQFARCLSQLDAPVESAIPESKIDELQTAEQQNAELESNSQEQQAPKLMLLDEPTAALDLRHQHSLLKSVKYFTQQGNSAIVAIHDLNLAALYADKVMLIKDGKLAYKGSPQSVLTSEILSQTYQTPINVMPYPQANVPMVYSAVNQ